MRNRRPSRLAPALLPTVLVLAIVLAPGAVADHITAHAQPAAAAPQDFAADFTPPVDDEWGWELGGFGGVERGAPRTRDPIIIVHGNTEDASFFEANENPPTVVNVRQRFRDNGYNDQEIWALSYNGARCGNTLACGSANDVNVPDLAAFITAVLDYTGADRYDLVGHSLGVTVIRATLRDHPDLLARADDIVLASGANHGTTACRGLESSWWGCDEIAPGSAWLDDLNSPDETPGDANWVTICDCTGVVDQFYVGPDARSPQLDGALNHEMPGTAHFSTVRGLPAFEFYLPILRDDDEPAATADPTPSPSPTPDPTPAPDPGPATQPLPTTGGGVAATALLLAGSMAWRRRRG